MDLSSSLLPKRIVILIDLHPLLSDDLNSNDYISRILISLRKILLFSSLSKSLFAFKLFISSLSPIQSSSKLNAPRHLSFQYPSQTLISLSKSLNSLTISTDTHSSVPRASFISKFLLTLEHDYSWENTDFDASVEGTNETSSTIRYPNLVLLFSPVYTTLLELEEKLDFSAFYSDFVGIFGLVRDRFVSKGIGFCWIGLDFDEQKGEFGFLERSIRGLDWGYCWADAIVLASAFVPFGMILNYIGCGMQFRFDKFSEKIQAELILEITDANGKPLEFKTTNFEVIELKPFLNHLKRGILKINIEEIWKKGGRNEVVENSIGQLAMRGIIRDCKQKQYGDKRELVVNKVLNLLCVDKDECVVDEPIWHIILSFLYRINCWASVSIVIGDGNLFKGILKPFTANYAVISIIETKASIQCQLAHSFSSETFAASIDKSKDGRKKRSKLHKKMFQQLTWNSLYETAFARDNNDALEMDLEEVYFYTETSRSKKMRFLKCWLTQMKKSIDCCQFKPNEEEEFPDHIDDVNNTTLNSRKELDVEASCSSANPEHSFSVDHKDEVTNTVLNSGKELDVQICCSTNPEPSFSADHKDEANTAALNSIKELDIQVSCSSANPDPSFSVDMEVLLKNIPEKIEHAICSKEMDLWNLAQRLVKSCVDVHSARSGNNTNNATPESDVLTEVGHLLLIKPKDLKLKYKQANLAPATSDHSSINCDEGSIIRAHELQILFRMEILKLENMIKIGDTVKQKFVREICSLLQNIEFHLQGQFLSGENLLDFAERTIKHRYNDSLKDIIQKIYKKMEFLSIGEDEMESPSSIPNSNSEEKKKEGNESNSNSIASTSHNSIDVLSEECIIHSQNQRERARRLSTFTSWVPDLHRVWALKKPKIKNSKPKRLKRERNRNEVVCETPMSAKKHSGVRDENYSGSSRSLSRALFKTEAHGSL